MLLRQTYTIFWIQGLILICRIARAASHDPDDPEEWTDDPDAQIGRAYVRVLNRIVFYCFALNVSLANICICLLKICDSI